tara:strand:- start:2222 stop:3820 length:1599 start_codon:yes stop_codon:yes gene_type:complete
MQKIEFEIIAEYIRLNMMNEQPNDVEKEEVVVNDKNLAFLDKKTVAINRAKDNVKNLIDDQSFDQLEYHINDKEKFHAYLNDLICNNSGSFSAKNDKKDIHNYYFKLSNYNKLVLLNKINELNKELKTEEVIAKKIYSLFESQQLKEKIISKLRDDLFHLRDLKDRGNKTVRLMKKYNLKVDNSICVSLNISIENFVNVVYLIREKFIKEENFSALKQLSEDITPFIEKMTQFIEQKNHLNEEQLQKTLTAIHNDKKRKVNEAYNTLIKKMEGVLIGIQIIIENIELLERCKNTDEQIQNVYREENGTFQFQPSNLKKVYNNILTMLAEVMQQNQFQRDLINGWRETLKLADHTCNKSREDLKDFELSCKGYVRDNQPQETNNTNEKSNSQQLEISHRKSLSISDIKQSAKGFFSNQSPELNEVKAAVSNVIAVAAFTVGFLMAASTYVALASTGVGIIPAMTLAMSVTGFLLVALSVTEKKNQEIKAGDKAALRGASAQIYKDLGIFSTEKLKGSDSQQNESPKNITKVHV